MGLNDILDTSTENSNENLVVTIDQPNVQSVTFTLIWQDEPDAGFRYTNQPDTFALEVTPPNSTQVTSPDSTSGTVSVTIPYTAGTKDPYYNGTGDYGVTVICGNCGDQEPFVNFGGFRTQADNGNTWTLEVFFNRYVQADL